MPPWRPPITPEEIEAFRERERRKAQITRELVEELKSQLEELGVDLSLIADNGVDTGVDDALRGNLVDFCSKAAVIAWHARPT